ncbi:MAG: hypothetical protein [Caudoviricetes sp.]|nr:MAG: hypothetical protein [Caudoviricetes sp.]
MDVEQVAYSGGGNDGSRAGQGFPGNCQGQGNGPGSAASCNGNVGVRAHPIAGAALIGDAPQSDDAAPGPVADIAPGAGDGRLGQQNVLADGDGLSRVRGKLRHDIIPFQKISGRV